MRYDLGTNTFSDRLHGYRLQRVMHSCFCTRVLLHIRSAYSNTIEYEDGPVLTSENRNWQFNLQDIQSHMAITETNMHFSEVDTVHGHTRLNSEGDETFLELGSKSTIYTPYSPKS